MIKICQECGKEFTTNNSMQKFCNNMHYRECVICGNTFEVSRSQLTSKDSRVTCSKKCSSELRKRTNTDKYGGAAPACSEAVRAKMKQTNMNRYGVSYASQSDEIKERAKSTNLSRYGFEYHSETEEHRKAVSDKWKDDSYRQSVTDKIASTNLERYGCRSVLSCQNIREKAKQTYKQKTGYDSPLSNPNVREMIHSTMLSRYGVEYPVQNDKISNQAKLTNLEKYGSENPMQNDEVLSKQQQTCLERYGNTCYLHSKEGEQVVKSKLFDRYGCSYFSKSRDWKVSVMIDPSKVDNLLKFRETPVLFIQTHFDHQPSLQELSNILGIHENSVGQLVTEFGLNRYVKYTYSYMEDEVVELILSIAPNIVIERNTRKIITPKEIDIYLPEYKIGIECNPTSTHNSTLDTFSSGPSKISYRYHQIKSDMCDELGIFLFHIFGYEWTHNKDVIKSMLVNLLNKNTNKLYARDLAVKNVPPAESRKFLSMNHRQGPGASSVRLGLYDDNNELVSLMTFGKMRKTIGTGNEDLSNCWELVRFCSKLDTTVVGGASKLFSNFLKQYDPVRIRSFSDRAHTKGALYSKLGFTAIRRSDPNYVWVDWNTDKAYHRVNAQKQNVKSFLNDSDIDLSRTEREIMIKHGFVQVYDSGTITWEWVND